MAITTTQILEAVKRRVTIPTSQELISDQDILAFGDDIMQSQIVPLLESTNQDFFVTRANILIVAGQSEYDIPYRTVGRALREIKMRWANTPLGVCNLTKIEIEEIQYYIQNSGILGFYILGDRIRLVPDVSDAYVDDNILELWYRLAPSKLILPEECCVIQSWVEDPILETTEITVDAVPDTITTSTEIDFIQARSGNRVYEIDKLPIGTTLNTLTFNTVDVPLELRVGDYIALSGQAPVATMIPNEAFPYLVTMISKYCLNSISDYEGMKMLDKDEKMQYDNLLKLVEPRVTGEPTVILNRTGLVRGNKWGQRRFLYNQ